MSNRAFILYVAESPIGKRYVGITARSIEDRWWEHLQESRASRAKRPICLAIRKYGAENFSVVELARADTWEALCQLEIEAIERLGTFAPGGYNLTRGGDGFTGRHSAESRRKMSQSHKGKIRTEEHKRSLSAALMGRVHPPEVIQKILNTKRGKPLTDAQRRGLAIMHAKNIGRVPTEEHRKKISEANRGVPKPTLRGRPLSRERRARISAAHKGRPLTIEHCIKLKAGWVKRRARNRSPNQLELL
jgi:group I intron endonuclease